MSTPKRGPGPPNREPWEERPLLQSATARNAEAFLTSDEVETLLHDVNEFDQQFGVARVFESGATRDSEDGKYDYEGFINPAVLVRYAEYMHKHRHQSDGVLRSSSNWRKGIPKDAYASSLIRHLVDFWMLHQGQEVVRPEGGEDITMEDSLTAIMFNVMGYLTVLLEA